mgnify:CR=1 FL=1
MSTMQTTPKGFRLHIAILGRRNVGKSSLLNAMTRQQVSIVSEIAGTTTDPVEKPMELLPLGPVLFIDTAGIDDVGALGTQRVASTRRVLDRTEVALIVAAAGHWGDFEEGLLAELHGRGIPTIAVFNKADLGRPAAALLQTLTERQVPCVAMSASRGEGILELREALLKVVPGDFLTPPSLLADLVPPGELAVLVVPIDKEAPKGRLILPQVQSIRDLLDHQAACLVVTDAGLPEALARLRTPPALVVTDSQAFERVSADTPPAVPMTSFSILFARFKGDLTEFARGAAAIAGLRPGDRVLVAEACSHHPVEDDIGRVKIPRWLQQHVGGAPECCQVQGHDLPDDLTPFRLVVHCGSCVSNRSEVLSRLLRCRSQGVPVTNYGMAIAASLGILDRALRPFPAALAAYHESLAEAAPAMAAGS